MELLDVIWCDLEWCVIWEGSSGVWGISITPQRLEMHMGGIGKRRRHMEKVVIITVIISATVKAILGF